MDPGGFRALTTELPALAQAFGFCPQLLRASALMLYLPLDRVGLPGNLVAMMASFFGRFPGRLGQLQCVRREPAQLLGEDAPAFGVAAFVLRCLTSCFGVPPP